MNLSENIKISKYEGPLVADPFMMVNAIPIDGISDSIINLKQVCNFKGAAEVPFGIARLSYYHLELMQKCIKKLVYLDNKIRKGLESLFKSDPDIAAMLVRKTLNLQKDQNPFIERLIKILTQNPALCHSKTILYRIDGLNGGDKIVVNEVNANPMGAFWLNEISSTFEDTQGCFGISSIPNLFRTKLGNHIGFEKAYYYPVRRLEGSSAYTEKMILKKYIDELGANFFMGTPEERSILDR